MRADKVKAYVTAGLVAMAAAWPSILCALIDAFSSPLDRAMRGAICGDGPGAVEFLGHCPACWAGAATFIAAAALAQGSPSRLLARLRA